MCIRLTPHSLAGGRMAFLESVNFIPTHACITHDKLSWVPDVIRSPIPSLPQIFWTTGESWREVNLWVLEKIYNDHASVATVLSLVKHLHAYANFLEDQLLDWRHFPIKLSERATVRFRGYLIGKIEGGDLAPSTARSRISAVIQFYKYASDQRFVESRNIWRDRIITVRYFDTAGFPRALQRMSTDLAIPNRVAPVVRLEDGLLPLSDSNMTELLELTLAVETEEMHLMLSLGFFTGARLGTVSSLTIECLEQARPDAYIENIYLVRIGPGTGVATKFNVSGELLIPKALFEALKAYAYSIRRLKRESRASPNVRSLIFLTSRGNGYSKTAMGVLMSSLRRKGVKHGLKFMSKFKFHQTRATYGTWLMKLALKVAPTGAAIEFVRNAMFHKHESTTFRYVKFIESTKGKQEAAKAFHEAFSGLHERKWKEFIT
ncbi:transposase [Pseudomonas putida]|uniref:Transposase n=2 Tax=Pseudomonas TaxID=286 RepID=A0A7U6M093_PSEPU|nr:transposase [Pseudomonas putida]